MTTLKLTVAAGTIMTLMGCASEDIDDGDDLLDSDVASAQQAVFTTYRDCSDPMVHPSQPGGDLVVTRDMMDSTIHQCVRRNTGSKTLTSRGGDLDMTVSFCEGTASMQRQA